GSRRPGVRTLGSSRTPWSRRGWAPRAGGAPPRRPPTAVVRRRRRRPPPQGTRSVGHGPAPPPEPPPRPDRTRGRTGTLRRRPGARRVRPPRARSPQPSAVPAASARRPPPPRRQPLRGGARRSAPGRPPRPRPPAGSPARTGLPGRRSVRRRHRPRWGSRSRRPGPGSGRSDPPEVQPEEVGRARDARIVVANDHLAHPRELLVRSVEGPGEEQPQVLLHVPEVLRRRRNDLRLPDRPVRLDVVAVVEDAPRCLGDPGRATRAGRHLGHRRPGGGVPLQDPDGL